MNLTDLEATSVHEAFEEVSEKAAARGLRVTGSEIVGNAPLRVLREAGEDDLRRQQRSLGIPASARSSASPSARWGSTTSGPSIPTGGSSSTR